MSEHTNTLLILGAIIICGIAAMLLWEWIDNGRGVVVGPTNRTLNENNQRHYFPPSVEPDEE